MTAADPLRSKVIDLPSMPFGWIGHTAKLAAHLGIDVRPALREVGVGDSRVGIGDDTPIRPDQFLLMGALIINGIDDEMHGVASTPMVRGTGNLMVQAALSATSLEGAINSFARFFRLAGTHCRLELSSDSVASRLIIRSQGDSSVRHVIEEIWAIFLHSQLSSYLDFFLPLSSFGTPARHHPLMGTRHSYLLCPVIASQDATLTFPTSYLSFRGRPRAAQNPQLLGLLKWLDFHDEVANGCFNRDGDEDSMSAAVFRLLSDELVGLDVCLGKLGLTEKQLRYRLWREGTTFRRLRQAALIEHGAAQLSSGACTDDLAQSMRYSDARSIRRALKTAAGVSISDLRQGLRKGVGGPAVIDRLRLELARLA